MANSKNKREAMKIEDKTPQYCSGVTFRDEVIDGMTFPHMQTHTVGRKKQPVKRIAESLGIALISHKQEIAIQVDFIEGKFITTVKWQVRQGCLYRGNIATFENTCDSTSIETIRSFVESLLSTGK